MTQANMRILYLTATGSADPTRASLAFHLAANGAAAAGYQADIVLVGDAAELVKGDVAAGVRGVGIPPLVELLEQVRARAIAVHV
jgi:predicted peroxiredoxin